MDEKNKKDKEPKQNQVLFYLDEATYKAVKTLAMIRNMYIKDLLGEIIRDHIRSLDKRKLVGEIFNIPPEERLTSIHKQEAAERTETKKPERYRISNPKKSKKTKK